MILVTGSTGIVGSRLVFDLISEGFEVRALKRHSSDIDFVRKVFSFYNPSEGDAIFKKISWAEGDLLDVVSIASAMEGVNQVYHAAAMVSYSPKRRAELMKLNVEGTSNMVDCAIESGVSHFCHISSVAALGANVAGKPLDENAVWKKSNATSVYGISKYLGEMEVWRGVAEGLCAIAVNPSIILGPSKDGQSSGMLMSMLRRGINYFPTGAAGFVDVRDVSRASIGLVKSNSFGERFLLNSECIPYRSLIEKSADVYGHAAPKHAVRPWMLECAWMASAIGRALTGSNPRITKETARSAFRVADYSNAKVRDAIGMDFISVSDSLRYFSGFYAK